MENRIKESIPEKTYVKADFTSIRWKESTSTAKWMLYPQNFEACFSNLLLVKHKSLKEFILKYLKDEDITNLDSKRVI